MLFCCCCCYCFCCCSCCWFVVSVAVVAVFVAVVSVFCCCCCCCCCCFCYSCCCCFCCVVAVIAVAVVFVAVEFQATCGLSTTAYTELPGCWYLLANFLFCFSPNAVFIFCVNQGSGFPVSCCTPLKSKSMFKPPVECGKQTRKTRKRTTCLPTLMEVYNRNFLF